MVTVTVAPRRGLIKSLRHITVGHLLGTVADELWEILAHAASVPRWLTHRGGARRTLMYERFGL